MPDNDNDIKQPSSETPEVNPETPTDAASQTPDANETNSQTSEVTPDTQAEANAQTSEMNTAANATDNIQTETTEENFQEELNNMQDLNTVTVQPVQFASFEDLDQVQGPQNQNLNILLDVKLQLSVELGKTDLPIKKVLELTKGSIVTLNKAAGEPVELYANGKLIAFGEVVVIEDNFGLRITHITDPVKRLNTINSGRDE